MLLSLLLQLLHPSRIGYIIGFLPRELDQENIMPVNDLASAEPKKSKKVLRKAVDTDFCYVCEWCDCTHQSSSMNEFNHHVGLHRRAYTQHLGPKAELGGRFCRELLIICIYVICVYIYIYIYIYIYYIVYIYIYIYIYIFIYIFFFLNFFFTAANQGTINYPFSFKLYLV